MPARRSVTRRGTRKGTPVRIIQPRTPGITRQVIASAVDQEIERAITREMRRYGVSRSFVVKVALAYTFGIELDERNDYRRHHADPSSLNAPHATRPLYTVVARGTRSQK